MKLLLIITIALATLTPITTSVNAQSGAGSVTLNIQGFGTVHGQLQDPMIYPNYSVSMLMVVDDQLKTSQGTFPLQATGNWDGTLDNSSLAGTIDNISGKINVCILLSCNSIYFTGQGNWTGQLDAASNGAGNSTATITITNSPYPQIPQGASIPTSGPWTASFTSPTPEFNANSSLLLALLTAASLIVVRSRRKKE